MDREADAMLKIVPIPDDMPGEPWEWRDPARGVKELPKDFDLGNAALDLETYGHVFIGLGGGEVCRIDLDTSPDDPEAMIKWKARATATNRQRPEDEEV
jgi:hypothetical protein